MPDFYFPDSFIQMSNSIFARRVGDRDKLSWRLLRPVEETKTTDWKMSKNTVVALAFLAAIGLATAASAQGEEDDPSEGQINFTVKGAFNEGDTKKQKTTARLEYAGVSRVYAIIPNLGMNGTTRVRITCEAAQECAVFLKCTEFMECDAQTGMRYFGELSGMIDSGATEVLGAEDIANVLGADAGWDGLLSCEVLSTGEASVQVLVRQAADQQYFF